VVGYRRGWRRWLLHRAVEPPRGGGRRLMVAREQHVLGLVAALGCSARGTHLELFVTPQEEAVARGALEAGGVAPGRPIAALAPGASFGPSKLWPARAFAAVGDALARAGMAVVVVGSGAERPLCAEVVQHMAEPAADLAGAVDLGGLKALLRDARLLVCNDAGARHVAVAFGVPCVVLMGPTALEKTDMNLEGVSVLSADVACRPCYRRECPIDHRCMERIPAEAVVEEALRALDAPLAHRFQGRRRLLAGSGRA
jgi:heptosyltransferase-2